MRHKRQPIHLSAPADLVEAIDRIAEDEMLSRADVIRRAMKYEAMAADGTLGMSSSPDVVQ